jgi:hypothetical protein
MCLGDESMGYSAAASSDCFWIVRGVTPETGMREWK